MDAADDEESHGKLVPVSEQSEFQFHLVFSNKTQTDGYCLEVWGRLTTQGMQVWQQQKNIPKDSDNWCAPACSVSLSQLGVYVDECENQSISGLKKILAKTSILAAYKCAVANGSL